GGPSGGTPPEILDELEEVSEEAAREVPRVFAKLGSDFKKADKNIKYWFSTNGGARDFFKELNNQLANLSSHMSVVRKDVQTHKNLHPKLASAFGTWSAQVNEAGEASESHFDAALGSLELVKEDVDRNVSSPSHPDTVLNYVNFQTGRIADLISSLSSSSKENDVVKARLAEANEKLQKLTEPLPVLEDLSRKTESHKESLRKSSLEPERQVFSRLKEELKKSIKDCSDSLANVERNSSARVEKLLEVIDESNEKAGNCVEKIREVLKSLEDTNSFVGEIDEVIGDLSTWLGSANDIMMTFITDNDALVNELRIIEKELKEKEEEVEEKEFNFASELKSQKELLAKAVQEVEDDLFSLSDRTTNKNWADKPLERKQYEIAQVIGKLKKRTTSKSLTDSIIAVCSELENKPESPLTKQELALQKAIDNFKETFTPFEEQLLKSFDKSKKGVLAEKEDYWQTQVPQAIKTLTGELERLKKFVPVLNGAYLKLKNK
ncbi:hypothetical protein HZA97_03745, partial [Candidatus Woesearchaeota archaeon]|nr:hypothetical protein [Candidatus Woesearchaeota archaeon]